MHTILVVDDEPDIRAVMRFALEEAEFRVLEADHAAQAHRLLTTEPPDLLLLDWLLPGQSGLEMAQQIKLDPKTRRVPIIMVSARGTEDDRVIGLNSGIDDYITKPFSPREMIARVNAVLRRSRPEAQNDTIEIGGLCIDHISRRVSIGEHPLDVAPAEYRLLHFFMTHPDRAYSRSQLLDQVWGDQAFVETRTVDVHIRRLRKAMEATGHDQLLQTVRGIGYRFSDKPRRSQ